MDYFNEFLKQHPGFQQDHNEIASVAKLIGECSTYLEVGTAEGGSLYYFANHWKPEKAVCVDLAEDHTREVFEWVAKQLNVFMDITLMGGNSTDPAMIDAVKVMGKFDVVFIDGGHDYDTVKSDWENYGQLATKYVVFHDICLPDVRKLWESIPGKRLSLIGDGRFGMGLLYV